MEAVPGVARVVKRTPLVRKHRLAPMSAKRRAQVQTRRDTVLAVHARDRYCRGAAVWPEVECGGPLDCHEPLPRSRGGNPLDPAQVILLCRRHHDAAHQNPTEAKARGLLL